MRRCHLSERALPCGHGAARRSSGLWLLAALAVATGAPLAQGAPERSYIEHVGPPGSKPLPFSDAVLTQDTLYVAGHLGIDPRTGNAAADAAAEARAVLEAVKRTVEAAGFAMDDLVSVTVFCTDLGLYDTFNSIYQTYFHGHYPARAFIGADKLVRGAHFEVLGVAVKTPRKLP
jgi:2-iminobutanoate/2-iminopropanoate deaminase